MEFSIRVLVVLMICLVVALIVLALIFGFGGEIQDLGAGIFGFFRQLLGLGSD